MISRDQIIKIDILTADNRKILSAAGRQFSIQAIDGGINGGDSILILRGKDLPEMYKGDYVSVIMSMRNGQRIRFPSFISVSTVFQLNVVIRNSEGKSLTERRRYYKVEVDIDCVINCVERDDNRTVLAKPYITKIRDINIGGIFLCICDEPLEVNDKLMITIDLDYRTLDLEAVILRVQRDEFGEIVGYGCQFLHPTAAEEDIISKYIFELQKERLREEAENRI